MSDNPTPTTIRRQLGAQLRSLRQQQGLTAQDVAMGVGFSVSKVSRMETGARAVSPEDMESLIAFFRLDADLADRLRDAARSGKRRRTPAPNLPAPEVDYLKIVQSGFVELERDAEYVREFNSGVVPGLLQTTAYMRALMTAAVPDDLDAVEKGVDLRLRRQARLSVRGAYSAVLDEAVLARIVGGREVMRAQMAAMTERVAEGVAEVRIVPFDAGPHPGLNSVFVTLRMGPTGAPDVVFVEGLVGHQRFDKDDDLDRFDRVWSQLTSLALSPADSRELLEHYERVYAGRADAARVR